MRHLLRRGRISLERIECRSQRLCGRDDAQLIYMQKAGNVTRDAEAFVVPVAIKGKDQADQAAKPKTKRSCQAAAGRGRKAGRLCRVHNANRSGLHRRGKARFLGPLQQRLV